jgi:uncharacterized membrane protein
MDPQLAELADLAIRWVHVIAGIMWIGNSLLFNWLDRNLEQSSITGEGLQGEIWLLHSGGFYFVEKTMLAGRSLPSGRQLHWFKWQAYITWLSGAALLVVVYYVGARALLVDPSVSALSTSQGVGVGVGAIVGGWLSYELLWRVVAPRSMTGAALLSLGALVALAVALTAALSGRAAFLHFGAVLGTIMAGNVLTTIMPSQRALVRAVEAGGRPDPGIAAIAKTRSIHNNYLTFPVILLMVSSHFPAIYGHQLAWLQLLVLTAAGAAVRHLLNVRFTFRQWVPALATTVTVAALLVNIVMRLPDARVTAPSAGDDALPAVVSFAEAQRILDRRCAACHSNAPSDVSLGMMPAGIAFDEPEQTQALAARIRERAVTTHTMPPGNKTRITDRERAILARWIEQGAPIR